MQVHQRNLTRALGDLSSALGVAAVAPRQSDAAIADALGVARTTVLRARNGRASVEMAAKIAAAHRRICNSRLSSDDLLVQDGEPEGAFVTGNSQIPDGAIVEGEDDDVTYDSDPP